MSLQNNWFYETNLKNYTELQETLLSDQKTNLKLQSWLITGTVGVGKTHNAILLARDYLQSLEYIHYSKLPYFIQFNDFITAIQAQRFGTEAQKNEAYYKLRDIKESQFLIIDDLHLDFSSKHEKALVEGELLAVLSEYWANRKSKIMIITSNYSKTQIKNGLSEAICSRLFGMCKYIEVTGKDKRNK